MEEFNKVEIMAVSAIYGERNSDSEWSVFFFDLVPRLTGCRGYRAVNGLLNENVVLLIFVLIFYWSLLAVHVYNCMYTYACCFLAYLYI